MVESLARLVYDALRALVAARSTRNTSDAHVYGLGCVLVTAVHHQDPTYFTKRMDSEQFSTQMVLA